jgi:hypothetical protein
LAAGVSFVALMLLFLFVCCLLPLFYYQCRPKFRKPAKFNLKEWFKKHLTPKTQPDEDDMPDFEKDNNGRQEDMLYEKPNKLRPHRKQLIEHDGQRRTSLHIQLKETPAPLEMSISDVEEETEYVSEMSDIGNGNSRHEVKNKSKEYKSKNVPTTPASILDKAGR